MPSAPAAFLDPLLLARIGDLALLARTVVDGFMAGLHRSSRKGLSIDFAEHRQYQPGDDLRRIDWRAYARTDRFYVKEYEADTNAGLIVALDVSGSMDFGTVPLTKFVYGRMLGASLAWLSQRQGDRVGLAVLRAGTAEVIPPSTRHLQLLLHTLGRTTAQGESALPAALDKLAHVANRAGIVVLISDCYEDPLLLARAIGTLRARGHDVIVFHLVDPAERDFPFTNATTFEDAETGERIPLRPEALAAQYRELYAAHRTALQQRITATGADYVPVLTDQPLDHALYAYLDRRLSSGKVR
jgi:uncharacterized protein (DUF58 family)